MKSVAKFVSGFCVVMAWQLTQPWALWAAGQSSAEGLNCGGVCLQMLEFVEHRRRQVGGPAESGRFQDHFVRRDVNPAAELERRYPELADPEIDLNRLHHIAQDMGFDVAMASFDPANPPIEARQIIAHRSDDHFVLLSRSDEGEWYLVDPPYPIAIHTKHSVADLTGRGILVLDDLPAKSRWPLYAVGLILPLVVWWTRSQFRRGATLAFLLLWPLIGGCESKKVAPFREANSDQNGLGVSADDEPPSRRFGFKESLLDLGSREVSAGPVNLEVGLYSRGSEPPEVTTSCGCTRAEPCGFDSASHRWKLAIEISPLTVGRNDIQITAKDSSSGEVSQLRIHVTGTSKLEIAMDPVLESQSLAGRPVYWAMAEVVGTLPSEEDLDVRFQCPVEFGFSDTVSVERLSPTSLLLQMDASDLSSQGAGFFRFFDARRHEVCPALSVAWKSPALADSRSVPVSENQDRGNVQP